MHGILKLLRDVVDAMFARPDEVMLEVGAGGELLVARLRVIVSAMLLLLPLANALSGGTVNETLIGLGGAIFVNLFAQVWLAPAAPTTSPRPPWCWCCWRSTTCLRASTA